MTFLSSFPEKKLYLQAELPVGATLPRLHNVGIGSQLSINRQLAEPEELSLPTPPPIGTVQGSLLAANQFAGATSTKRGAELIEVLLAGQG